jgi:D-alanine-D-alanine ligase
MKMLLVYGGDGLTDEAEVSINSGEKFTQALEQVDLLSDSFVLTKNNQMELAEKLPQYDLVISLIHGTFGEDGQIQKIFETADVKYLGSDSIASALCFDKQKCKQRLQEQGIATPRGFIVYSFGDIIEDKLPLILKPISSGSSVDLIVARQLDNDTTSQIEAGLTKYGELLAEEFISGQEIAVGILGDEALPVIEIIPPAGRVFDYGAKYSGESLELCPPQNISPELQRQAQAIALTCHRVCGCRHLSRVDMMVQDNKIIVLEVNTLPGMTPESLYPKEALCAGYNFPALVKELVELATN